MASAPHPVFIEPRDRNAKVWRYMDFTKYVAMLESQALYLCRADQFDDPFEGAISQGAIDHWNAQTAALTLSEEQRQQPFKLFKNMRHWTYLNCWHMSEHESAAMWRLYSKSDEAIAVQSTFSKLSAALPDNVYLGVVLYVDYDKTPIPMGNTFWPYVHKRLSFEHEREVRAVMASAPGEGDLFDHSRVPQSIGELVPVSLSDMLESIYVAPYCGAWYSDLVLKVTERFGLKLPVKKSRLADTPV